MHRTMKRRAGAVAAVVAALAFAAAGTPAEAATITDCSGFRPDAPAVLVCSYDDASADDVTTGDTYGGASSELGTTYVVDRTNATFTYASSRFQPSPSGHVMQMYEEGVVTCPDGMFLPFFIGEDSWSRTFRTILYFVALMWCFLGIAIIADEFMAAIEVITSKERDVPVKSSDGKIVHFKVLVWNETVANLTLMALGSSAPEILLAVIETCAELGLPPRDGLGPSTIVGSAAFNLLVIVGICVISIPDGEVRKIKELGVFSVTAFFSVFAYVWMLFVLQWNTENEVEIWEAIVTFMFFPLLVGLAYGQDVGWGKKKVTPQSQHLTGTSGMGARGYGAEDIAKMLHDHEDQVAGITEEELAELAANEVLAHKRKTIATHRVQAGRALTGQARVYKGRNSVTLSNMATLTPGDATAHEGESKTADEPVDTDFASISFGSATYACLENCGEIELVVVRTGDMDMAVDVNYETSNGTAVSGADYDYTAGTLHFGPGEGHKVVPVKIVDDNEFEPDETFYMSLRLHGGKDGSPKIRLGRYPITEITIINDDTPGEFSFEQPTYSVVESAGAVEVAVVRKNGSDGVVRVKYATADTPKDALAGKDYKSASGVLEFEHGEMRKTFTVNIIDDGDYEKDEAFAVTLDIEGYGSPDCGALYGPNKEALVTITNDEEFKNMVDRVTNLMNLNMDRMKLSTTTWAEQFVRAMEVAGEDGDPSRQDYILHFLSFFWKVVFSFVPPTSMGGGWVAFCTALVFIGLLTALVGNLASTFGCLLGLNDAVTAITFVALGTSLPDTFASRAAAVNDAHADASIGNVTGSNSVNVFLGLGLPWVIAVLYHAIDGTTYIVKAGSLSFSVLLFCMCAVVCIAWVYIRRIPAMAGAELGGPKVLKWATAVFFFTLWMIYVTISSMKSMGKLD